MSVYHSSSSLDQIGKVKNLDGEIWEEIAKYKKKKFDKMSYRGQCLLLDNSLGAGRAWISQL